MGGWSISLVRGRLDEDVVHFFVVDGRLDDHVVRFFVVDGRLDDHVVRFSWVGAHGNLLSLSPMGQAAGRFLTGIVRALVFCLRSPSTGRQKGDLERGALLFPTPPP